MPKRLVNKLMRLSEVTNSVLRGAIRSRSPILQRAAAEPKPAADWRVVSAAGRTDLSTQHMSSRCEGTLAGLSRAGQSERMQARKARVRRLRSSEARPSHRRRRLGQVHSRKHSAGTSSGVSADLALLAHHSFTITGGTGGEQWKGRGGEREHFRVHVPRSAPAK